MNHQPLRKYLKYDTHENLLLWVDKDTPLAPLATDLAEAFDIDYQIAEDLALRSIKADPMDAQTLEELALEVEVATILHRLAKAGQVDYGIGEEGEWVFSRNSDSEG